MRRKTFLRQEQGYDRPSGTPRPASSRTPLYLRGKIEPLDRSGVLSLSAGHGTGVLVPLAVLDGRRLGRRPNLAPTAPLGRTALRRLRFLHVQTLGRPDAFQCG